MKIIQKRTILLLITFFIAPVILSFVFVPTASAADPRDTATKKEWYSIVQDCATSERGWNVTNYLLWPVRGGIVISSDALRKGNWFHGNASPWTGIGSPLVEKMIDGKYEDGKINCGSQDNKLVQDGVSGVLGLTNYREVICNRNTGDQLGKIGYGVLGQDNEDSISCNDAFDDTAREDTYFMYLADNAKGYLDDLVTAKTFSGDVPGGALDELTKAEEYYVLHDAFIYACAQGSGRIITPGERGQPVYWISEIRNGETVDIGYSERANPDKEGYVTYFYDKKAKCKDIAARLQQGNSSGLFDAYKAAIESGETQEDPNAGNNNQEERNCQNSGGAGSLGWIVCSILDWMSDATNGLYTNVVEPALRVEPEIFQGGDSIGAERAWGYFRDFANILFIIVVLVVIFSQLTGVGIDNYGIKKILPKLIIVAILVNLSYLICLLCVDLSNIVGNGVQGLFNNIPTADVAETITLDDDTIEINTNTGDNVGADIGIVAVGLVSGAVGAFAIYSNPALLLTLFVSVLGVLISVLFVFILLAGRKAAIVLLTVISPIAFILYMLPNTKKIYDKWFNIWKAMLIVYPACGLLIGGGNFASKLMLSLPNSSTSAATMFIAMIVGIVPIFFIPSLIKGAYAALGTIGGTLAGFGGRLRGGATNRMRNSNAYKNAQKRGQERNTRVRAGYNAKGRPTRIGAAKARFANTWIGRVSGYQSAQAARVAAANKLKEEGIQSTAELSEMNFKYQQSRNGAMSTEDELTEALKKARDKGDANKMFAVIEQARRSNMQASHIANMTRTVLGDSSKLGNMTDGQRKNFLEEFGKKYGGDFLKKDYEQADWARKGGVSAGAAAGITNWAQNNIAVDDLKDEDVSSLSSERLSELIRLGKISKSQAQRVWAANGSMDDTSRLILGAYGNAGTQLSKQQAQFEIDPNRIGPRLLTQEQIDAYTERAAMDTRIRDVDIRNKKGEKRQTDDLGVRNSTPPTSTP